MLNLIQRYPKSFLAALLVHVVTGVFFVITFDWTAKAPEEEPEVNVVQATAVDESQVQAELEKLRAMEAARKKKEDDRVKRLEDKAAKAKAAREKEQKRIRELEKKRKAEAKRKAQLEKERKQAEAQAKKAAEARQREEAAAAEAERKRKAAEEANRKAEAEAKRLRDEQRRAEEERLRQKALEEEEARMAAERAKREQSTVAKYVAMIRNQVDRAVKYPPGLDTRNLSCDVRVRILSNGNVLDVRVIKSSGNALFDTAVQRAVQAAAPLPVPRDPAIYSAYFRELEFTFKPGK